MYAVHVQVWTVPSSSIFVTTSTYVFTFVFVTAYGLAAVWLTGSVSRMVSNRNVNGADGRWTFWMAYECGLLAVVVATTFAVGGRWRLMEQAGERYAEAKETEYVASVTGMCRAHRHLAALASVAAAMTVFRTYRLVTGPRSAVHAERALRESGDLMTVAGVYALTVAFGLWYCSSDFDGLFYNEFVLGRRTLDPDVRHSLSYATVTAVAVYYFFSAMIMAIITKRYVLSKMYSQQRWW